MSQFLNIIHNAKYNDFYFRESNADFPIKSEDLVLVAQLQGEDLDKAFELTNSIDKNWWENKGIYKFFEGKGCRSTSVGDIIFKEDPFGDPEAYVVDRFGFTRWEAGDAICLKIVEDRIGKDKPENIQQSRENDTSFEDEAPEPDTFMDSYIERQADEFSYYQGHDEY